MAGNIREIAINARRARFMADHWVDEQGQPNLDVSFEVACVRRKIEELMKGRPEFRAKLAQLDEVVATREFWENLAVSIDGTHFAVCGLEFQIFEYYSALKPLWGLEVYESHPSGGMSSDLPRQKRKWGCHPIGCLGRVGKLLLKLVLPVWLVLYAIHLWSPPAGDAPKPEPEKPKPVVAEKKAEAQPKAAAAEQPAGTLAIGTRVVAKKAIPIYRLNEEKKPVVAGRVPAGTVLEVTGTVNAKVVRVSVELPNGKKGKGMARVADLEE